MRTAITRSSACRRAPIACNPARPRKRSWSRWARRSPSISLRLHRSSAIVVVGSRTKDVKTPAVATNVSRFQLENLPNGDRNFLNFAELAPGVTVSPPQLGGKARQVQAGAINSDNTNTFIDGLSIKNLVNHGGTLGQNLSSGNPFPASAVDQFDVQTQNFKAEFEQAGSAVISSVTKTGGNQFHGEIFGEWQPKPFISENYDDRAGHLNNPDRGAEKTEFPVPNIMAATSAVRSSRTS